MSCVHYFLATGFFSGYSPIAPGTVASLLILILFPFYPSITFLEHFFFILVILILGIWSSSKLTTDQNKDPSIVVIDEMVGMLIALVACPKNVPAFVIAFLLFRFFDIVKPFPINMAEKLPQGWGIMMDDVVAGLYAFFLLQLLLLLRVL